MPQKEHKPEEIVAKLRQADVLASQGQAVAEAVRITALLCDAGWVVNVKRVERIWRREGLKVPQKQPKKGRLWLNDGSCIRLRPTRPNHVWPCDFVESRTHDGRTFRMLNLIDAFPRECLAIRIDRRLRPTDVIAMLSDQVILRSVPDHIRSDNARSLWQRRRGAGSPRSAELS